MFGQGVPGGLTAKLAGLGTAAKVALATATATATVGLGVTAAVATGAVGGGAASAGAATGAGVTVHAQSSAASPVTSAAVSAETHASGSVSVPAPTSGAGAAGSHHSGGSGTESLRSLLPSTGAPTTTGSGSTKPAGLTGAVPNLSSLSQIPTQVMSCLAPIFNMLKTLPTGGVGAGSVGSATQLGSTIVGCVTNIVKNVPLPFGLNSCISNILGFVNGAVSNPGSVPNLSGLNISACIPSGLPIPNFASFFGFFGGGGLPFGS